MAAEQVKKPVGGAYGIFMNEKRDEFKQKAVAAGDKSFGGAAKLASAAWKAMGDKEKAPYEEKYKAAKLGYDNFKNSDAYVAPEKKGKKQKGDAKPQKDKDAPKRPAGGAYGIFMNEKRDEFKEKALAAGDKSFAGPTKLGAAAWKAIKEKEKAGYEKKYQEAKARYDEELAKYQLSKPEAAPPAKEEKTAGKRGASAPAEAPAAKRKKGVKTASVPEGVELDAAVLKEADGLGYLASLKNLANRKMIVDGGFQAAKILRALKASGGLVNKAQSALLGGA